MTALPLTVIVNLQGEENSPIPLTTWESWFQTWVIHLKPDLGGADSYEVSLRLSDDSEIQSLNAQYRHKNEPTDVLAFAALEVDFPQILDQCEPLYLGDLVISVETAARVAAEQGHSLSTEIALCAAHGLLHLLGWDHPDDDSLMAMLSQQETLLTLVGLFS